jgi:hypothetical protein
MSANKNMGANAKFGDSILSLAILFLVLTAPGWPAAKVQKQDKEEEVYKLAGKYAKQERWQDLVDLCQRRLRDNPTGALQSRRRIHPCGEGH